ncbi:MAG: PD-(D/E)XK nuclease family protein [Eubacteriales bacterium]|nr:PD-(D/E)XK nuclease family protein [Eubacteriales bacterium]
MKLTVLAGRGGSGKTYRVYEEIGRSIDAGEEYQLLLVPELFTYNAEKDLINQLGKPGIMTAQVLSPSRLQTRIFEETGGRTIKRPDRQTRLTIVRACIDRHAAEMEMYARSYRLPEFAEQMLTQIRQLKNSDIRPEALSVAMERLENPEGALYRKLKAIHAVYAEYESFVAGRYLDMESGTDLLIERIDRSAYIRSARVWIDGFDMFGAKNIRLVRALVKNARSVTVTLTNGDETDEDGRAFEAQAEAAAALARTAGELGAEYRYEYLKGKDVFAPEIAHLERNLFLYGKSAKWRQGEPRCITAWRASTPEEECELAVLQIKKLVSEGYGYADIAVVCNALDEYEPLIIERFRASGIPFFLDTKRGIGGHPVYEMLTAAFDTAERGFEREEVMRYLRSGMAADADVDAVGRFDNYCRAYGIRYDGFVRPFVKGPEAAEREAERAAWLDGLIRFTAEIKAAGTAGEMCRAVRELMARDRVGERIAAFTEKMEERIAAGEDNGYLHAEIERTEQIKDKIDETLDRTEEIVGDERMNARDFFSILRSALLSYEIGVLPYSAQSVVVGNIKRTENSNIKALIWMAMNAEFLPAQPDRNGLFSDEENDELSRLGVKKEPDRRTERALGRFDIYSTACKATRKLIFSYAAASRDGVERHVSPVLETVKRIFPAMQEKSAGDDWALRDRETAFIRLTDGRIRDERLRAGLKEYFSGRPEYAERLAVREEAETQINAAADLDRETAAALYGDGCMTVSKLEDYDKCPYLFFVKNGLRAQETAEAEPDNRDVGTIYHDALKRYVDRIIRDGGRLPDSRAESDERAAEAFAVSAALYRENLLREDPVLTAHAERMKRQFAAAAWRITESLRNGRFRPAATEECFGPGERLPALTLRDGDGTELSLRGKIDRVDAYTDETGRRYVAVTDYKSGEVGAKAGQIGNETDLQAMIYLEALTGAEGAEPGYCVYFSLKDPVTKPGEKKRFLGGYAVEGFVPEKNAAVVNCTQEAFEAKKEAIGRKCLALYKNIRAGRVPIAPRRDGEKTACEYCRYGGICRMDERFSGNTVRGGKDDEIDA